MRRWRPRCAVVATMLAGTLCACSGGSSAPSPVPTTQIIPVTQSLGPNSVAAITFPLPPGSPAQRAELDVTTSGTFPSGVTATASVLTSNAPTPQTSQRRKPQSASVLAEWQITFSGSTATGTFVSSPAVMFEPSSASTNLSSLVVEMFDITTGAAPTIFAFDTGYCQREACGGTYNFYPETPLLQLALGDAYDLEVVSGSAHGSTTFAYTGSSQTFTVPSGISSLNVTAAGAQNGGTTSATISVASGATLDVEVGAAAVGPTGGYNGGGQATESQGGGGGSDVRAGGTSLADRVVVGGGGGGGGTGNSGMPTAGPGGGATGADGGIGGMGGLGGGPTAGGAGGPGCRGADPGTAGSFGTGGNGGTGANYGGGGGGGWYGAGGGGGNSSDGIACGVLGGGGGGGGSSYAEPSATNVTITQGGQYGNGYVTITW